MDLASLERIVAGRLSRLVPLEPGEAVRLGASFAFFFSVLTAYYIIRPVRDELGVMLGPDALKDVFVLVFVAMIAAVPVFGFIVTRFDRRRALAIVYLFLAANLVGYWWALSAGRDDRLLAKSFFVWVSVFNLFAVSLFWSAMADTWRPSQAKRLYGAIAAGGTVGALTGPLIAQSLVTELGSANLLLISAAFLCVCLGAARVVQGEGATAGNETDRPVTLHGVVEGAVQVWRSPYLFRIALWVLMANIITTYFYFEQARILGAEIVDRAQRVQLLARMDFAVGLLTVLLQIGATARVIERAGLGIAIAALPAAAMLGFVVLGVAPVLTTIIGIVVLERTLLFAFSNPAMRALYTVVEPDEKYKAQNFVDTVIYRGGDAASGWYFDALSKGLGLSVVGISVVTVPLAAVWCGLSFVLASMFAARGGDARNRAAGRG
jgi:AAA family ATP:ADP antiporter